MWLKIIFAVFLVVWFAYEVVTFIPVVKRWIKQRKEKKQLKKDGIKEMGNSDDIKK